MTIRLFLRASFSTLLVAASPLLLQAQSTASPAEISAALNSSRDQLEAAAVQFDRLAASTAYSDRTRASARIHASQVRRRLADGDFRVGDRMIITVGGSVVVTDTVTVLEGRRIAVQGIRQVSLEGVLRSELERKLLADLTEVVRNATVTARPLVRMAVFGSVTSPGYLSVPSETTLDHVLTLAGGPMATAAPGRTTLVRGDTVLLARDQVTLAVVNGRTLGDLGVRDGDALMVPPQDLPWDRNTTLQIVTLLLAPILTIFVVRR